LIHGVIILTHILGPYQATFRQAEIKIPTHPQSQSVGFSQPIGCLPQRPLCACFPLKEFSLNFSEKFDLTISVLSCIILVNPVF